MSVLLALLKLELNRTVTEQPDEQFLLAVLGAAKNDLARQGVKEADSDDWRLLTVGYAAWIYRKRISGEPMPRYLMYLRNNMLMSQAMKAEANSDEGSDADAV